MIIKLTDTDGTEYFLHWSTIQDAPLCYGCDKETLTDYWEEQYGKTSMPEFHAALRRADKLGCSSFTDTLDDIIALNRAGERGKHLTREELIEQFCKNWKG